MGVSGPQLHYSCGLPFWIQGKQAEPAPGQGRPDRTERPGFFLSEFRIEEENEIVTEQQVDCVFRHVLKATACVLVTRYERGLRYS
jgi:hypothetical protein